VIIDFGQMWSSALTLRALRSFCVRKLPITRNTFCGTWYLPHSKVHNERAVPIIMPGCIALSPNGRISTSGLESATPMIASFDYFVDCYSLLHVYRLLHRLPSYTICAYCVAKETELKDDEGSRQVKKEL